MTSSTKNHLARMPGDPPEATMAIAHAQRRQRASDRDLAGAPLEALCRAWACSNSWRYPWRERSLATAPAWSAAPRRRPRTTPTTTPQHLGQAVVALRHLLTRQGQGGGAAAIQQALAQPGRAPGPAQRTLERMLHR
jgi:hypothetical protein